MARHSPLSVILVALGSTLLGACAPGNPGLVVLGAVQPNERCIYDVGGMPQTGGIYDVGIYATGEPPVPSRDAAGYSLVYGLGTGC